MAAERGVRGKRLLVRADANVEIGTGHVMRCLALAQAWQDGGGAVTYAMRTPEAKVRNRLESENIATKEIRGAGDAAATVEAARESGANWVVLDGYGFGAEYQRQMQAAGYPVLFVDDYGHSSEYSAELVLNQNLGADEGWYGKRSPNTRLLLGTDYSLLRREFRSRGRLRNMFPEVARNVLITIGGADAGNVTALAISAVAKLGLQEIAVKVAVGPANPHHGELQALVAGLGLPIELVSTTTQMPELMEWADVAVSATGSTSWELLFMQVPFVGICVADNQRPGTRHLSEKGFAITLDFTPNLAADDIADALKKLVPDQHKRSAMARRGRELVDGNGVERVIAAMCETRA
ncbi:MAG: UDP-2,4-diacetamido-2,4,6-trideoxy-beta-L-altropyranose hydrolase [Acidobacteriia bacterium]|nr:UDP-2,4-diacetamido-2,4,6-trideoxy-beta-L-altropyranose hydrolase [Terriglobia bacterium]